MQVQISGLVQQLSDLVLLTGCVYMAVPSKPRSNVPSVQKPAPADTELEANPNLTQMFPPERLEAIKRKALRRYQAKQDAQWQHWLDNISR